MPPVRRELPRQAPFRVDQKTVFATALNALFLLSAWLVLGCPAAPAAQPEYQVQGEAKLQSYDKVYLAQIKKDVGKVYPMLLSRLKKCGLEVIELKPENLPFTSQGSGFLIDA